MPPTAAPQATLFAFLEECGYRLDQIRHLTRAYVRHVLQHRRDGEGRLALPEQPVRAYEDQARDLLFRRNWPAWAIDGQVARWRADREARAARRRSS